MDDNDRPVVERETTVINTGERSGGGGLIAVVVLLLIVGVGAFLFFGGYFEKAADEVDVNVNVAAPDIELPDIKIDTAPAAPERPANSTGN